jgi:hypothetical protein
MEKERGFSEDGGGTSTACMIRSPRSAFANLLNQEAIVGHHFALPKDYFMQWLGTIIGEQAVQTFKGSL